MDLEALRQFFTNVGQSWGQLPQAAMQDLRRAPQLGAETIRGLLGLQTANMMGTTPDELGTAAVNTPPEGARGSLSPMQFQALAEALRGMKTPLRRAVTKAPTDLNVISNPMMPEGGGSYAPARLASNISTTTGAVARLGTGLPTNTTPAPPRTVLSHEIAGHALPDMGALHPAARQMLMRFADEMMAKSPALRNYVTQPGAPLGPISTLQRTEGLAWPAERSLRSAAPMNITPDDIYAYVQIMRNASKLQRAATRNPAWGMSLGAKPPTP